MGTVQGASYHPAMNAPVHHEQRWPVAAARRRLAVNEMAVELPKPALVSMVD